MPADSAKKVTPSIILKVRDLKVREKSISPQSNHWDEKQEKQTNLSRYAIAEMPGSPLTAGEEVISSRHSDQVSAGDDDQARQRESSRTCFFRTRRIFQLS